MQYLFAKVLKDRCEACNEKDCLTYFLEKYHVVTCTKCGAVYTEQEMRPEVYNVEDKTEVTLITKIWTKKIHHFIASLYSNEYLKYLKSKANMRFKTALDIGTGYGTFVELLNKNGINAVGIESDQRIAKLSFNKKVRWEYFDQNYKSDTKYDLICMALMISFFRDNHSVLKCVKNMLTDNGLIFITLLNPQSELLKTALPLRLEVANMIFSKKNFQSLENKLGLRLVDYTTYRSNIAVDFQRTKNTKLAFVKYRLRLKKPLIPDPNGQMSFVLLEPSSK